MTNGITNEERIRNYFEREHKDFDASYHQGKGLSDIVRKLSYFVNRRAIERRLNALLQLVGDDIAGKKILEVGCGPGIYSISLARKGADVTALDYSKGMIETARRNAREAGVSVEFIAADFINSKIDETFDYVFATGVIEYIEKKIHTPFLKKMAEFSSWAVIVSFPKRGILHAFVRDLWLKHFKGIRISFFDEKDILSIASVCHLKEINRIDAGVIRVIKFKKA